MPGPRILTSRIAQYDDSHTIDRFLATGGYDGLRKALTMTPEQVQKEVLTSNLLGLSLIHISEPTRPY